MDESRVVTVVHSLGLIVVKQNSFVSVVGVIIFQPLMSWKLFSVTYVV